MTQDTSADLTDRPLATPGCREFAGRLLEFALRLTSADFGNVQLVDPDSGSLRIVVHDGFSDEFLEYFAVVDDEHSACGRAAQQAEQVVIRDVSVEPLFAPHVGIARSSGFRSVQSTPLIDRRGRLHGIVSTHYKEPHAASPLNLRLMEFAARLATDHLGAPARDLPDEDSAGESAADFDVMGSFRRFYEEMAGDMDDLDLSVAEFTKALVSGLLDLSLLLASGQNRAEDGPVAQRLHTSISELDRIVRDLRRDDMVLTRGARARTLSLHSSDRSS
jgi:GAF domain-containing protein